MEGELKKSMNLDKYTKHSVVKLSRAIGVERFGDEVKRGMYACTRVCA